MKNFLFYVTTFALGFVLGVVFSPQVRAEMPVQAQPQAPAPAQPQAQAPAQPKAQPQAPAPAQPQAQAPTVVQTPAVQVQTSTVQVVTKEEPKKEEPEQKEAPMTFTQVVGHDLSVMVPAYRSPKKYQDALAAQPFGKTEVNAYTTAVTAFTDPDQARVKVAVVDRLTDGFTMQVLGQDELHIPEYTQVIRKAALQQNVEVCESLQRDRFVDETAVNEMKHPSLWQRVKWWWNS